MAKLKRGRVMKKTKKVIIGITIIVSILIGARITMKTNPTDEAEEPSGIMRIPNEIIEGVHFGENGENYCLLYKRKIPLDYEWVDGEYLEVTTAGLDVNAKYIVSHQSIRYESKEWREKATFEERIKKYVLYIRSIDGEGAQTKEIDMQKVFANSLYFIIGRRGIVERKGKYYAELVVQSRVDNDEWNLVLFDLEEEIVIDEHSMFFRDSVKATYIYEVGEYSIPFIDVYTGNGTFTYSSVEELYQSRLAKEYPEIRELIERNEGEDILVTLYFEKVEDPDEIMRLFEKEGVNPFENTELGERASKDGKRHKINSFEDFLKWYDAPEDQKEEVEMLLGKGEE